MENAKHELCLTGIQDPFQTIRRFEEATSWSLDDYRRAILNDLSELQFGRQAKLNNGRTIFFSGWNEDGKDHLGIKFERSHNIYPIFYEDGRIKIAATPTNGAFVESEAAMLGTVANKLNEMLPETLNRQMQTVARAMYELQRQSNHGVIESIRRRTILSNEERHDVAGSTATWLSSYDENGVTYATMNVNDPNGRKVEYTINENGAHEPKGLDADGRILYANAIAKMKPEKNGHLFEIIEIARHTTASNILIDMKEKGKDHPVTQMLDRIRGEADIERYQQNAVVTGRGR